MKNTLFRMYDLRGLVGSEFIIEQTYDLVRAIAYYFYTKNPALKTVVVGMDGRTHSPIIYEQVRRALQDSGITVTFLGVCHSPLLYFALHTMPFDAGIMITASHNPKEYNGLKLCLGKESLWGDALQVIKDYYNSKKYIPSTHQGTCHEYDAKPSYILHLTQQFPHLVGASMPVVFDCGNGATGAIIPAMVQAFGWSDAQILYADVDGTYPHHEADPVVEANMVDVKDALRTTAAQVGIGFDGDGDRMAVMTKEGYLVPGDQALALFSIEYLRSNPGAAVVCDIKSSTALLDVVALHGGTAHLSPAGHSLIKKSMREYNAQLGGELSGHFFFYDTYFGFDDGIYAALRMLNVLHNAQVPLQTLLKVIPHTVSSPEFRIACAEDLKWRVVEDVLKQLSVLPNVSMITVDGIRATVGSALGILRASNTQAALSLRFEADSQNNLDSVKKLFINAMSKHIDPCILQKELAA